MFIDAEPFYRNKIATETQGHLILIQNWLQNNINL
jgi:hypothetical protein